MLFIVFLSLMSSHQVISAPGNSYDDPILVPQGSVTGDIDPAESIFYSFQTTAGGEYLITLDGESDTDFDMFLQDSISGEYIGRSDSLSYPEQIIYRAVESNEIIIQIFSLSSQGTFSLTISVGEVTTQNSVPILSIFQFFISMLVLVKVKKKLHQ